MNIVLISLDTTRADRLSCYGYRRRTSPHIDGLAAEGALFTDFFSPHIPTYPGHTTMLTGRDIYAHGVTGQSGMPELPLEIPTLAEMLAERGWYTAAADNLGRWFQRGFQRYEGYSWDTGNRAELRRGEAVTEAALRVLDAAAAQDRPFFLFLHYWDPHTPYLPPAPFSRMFYRGDEFDPANRSMDAVWAFEPFRWYFNEWMGSVTDIEFPKAQYDAEIAYMDECLGEVFARMRELRVMDDTLLAITADHGEELDEHAHWFDHHGLYDTNLRVPLILRLPGRLPAGASVPGFARTQDVAPTLLDYAGLLDPALQFDGISLRSALEGGASACDAVFATENTWMKKRAIRIREWKLIMPLETPDIHGRGEAELYDLAADPGERVNLIAERPEMARELGARLDEHVRQRCAETGRADPLPLQPIALRRIGKVEDSVPDPGKCKEGSGSGDFVGYEREPTTTELGSG